MRTPVFAIDSSLKGFAMRCLSPEGSSLFCQEIKTLKEVVDGDSVAARIRRYRHIADRAVLPLKQFAPEYVFIEGYAFSKKGSSASKLIELGGIVRDRLSNYAFIVEVAPSTVKKFATGKGTADKAAVASALANRYGLSFSTDNEADAFGLAQLGRVAVGYAEPETQFQRDSAEVVRDLVARAREAA